MNKNIITYVFKSMDFNEDIPERVLKKQYYKEIKELNKYRLAFPDNDAEIIFHKIQTAHSESENFIPQRHKLLTIMKETLFRFKWAFSVSIIIIAIFLFFPYLYKKNLVITNTYSSSMIQTDYVIRKQIFKKQILIASHNTGIEFQFNKKKFFLNPFSTILIKRKNIYLKKGMFIGEYDSHDIKENATTKIIANPLTITVVGTKFFVKKNDNNTTVFVEHGHLHITIKNRKSIDLLSQSYLTISNKKTNSGKLAKPLFIPITTKQTQEYNFITKMQNFNLHLQSNIIIKNKKNKSIPHYSFFYLDRFENYKLHTTLNDKQWDIWHFNSIVERPTIVTERHGNQICQFKFQGTNNYSEAGIKAVAPFNKKYETNNISAIQIKIKGKLSTKNQLLVRLYKKDGNIFQHVFSKNETIKLFNGEWNNLTLPNRESFWEYSSASNPYNPNLKKFTHFTNLEKLLIGIISKNDQQPHTLYFDDLSLIQKQ